MSADSRELLERLTQADGVPGHEAEVRAIFAERWSDVGEVQTDRLGNVYCEKAGSAAGPRVLVDSHMDEVGFLVQSITSAGFVRFVPVGGWWAHTLLAQRVRITTAKGKVLGVVGSTPPHLLGPEAGKKVQKIEDLYIDIGATDREDAIERFGLRPGCPIAPYAPFMEMGDPKVLSSKAFDNRVGCALVIEALEGLKDHPNTVIGAGCVQEEVGLRGARTLAPRLELDLAIVLEAPPADDIPGMDRDAAQGKLGGGAQIRLFDPTMIANPKLGELVIETAEAAGIPHQIAIRRSGGTNAGAIHQTGSGVPTVVLGVPTRYIHSHVSLMHMDDYAAVLKLLVNVLRRLDQATVDGLND